jgi:hypothetical protein
MLEEAPCIAGRHRIERPTHHFYEHPAHDLRVDALRQEQGSAGVPEVAMVHKPSSYLATLSFRLTLSPREARMLGDESHVHSPFGIEPNCEGWRRCRNRR